MGQPHTFELFRLQHPAAVRHNVRAMSRQQQVREPSVSSPESGNDHDHGHGQSID